MKIQRIQPETINVNGKIVTVLAGVPVNDYDLSLEEVNYLVKFLSFEKGMHDINRINDIINTACIRYGVTMEQVKSRTRKQPIVEARQYAFYLLRFKLHMSFQQIGYIFNLHHATVLHGVRHIINLKSINQLGYEN